MRLWQDYAAILFVIFFVHRIIQLYGYIYFLCENNFCYLVKSGFCWMQPTKDFHGVYSPCVENFTNTCFRQ